MLQPSLLFSCIGLLSVALGAPVNDNRPKAPYPKALYFNVNQVPNLVASVKVNSDGTLSDGATVATGGNGASAIQGQINIPAAPDSTLGTGTVAVVKDLVLAVNTGSNTVSVFKINPSNPTELTLLGNPVDSQGDFPSHIVYSEDLQQACVANSGTRAVISCYRLSSETGLTPLNSPIPLPYNNQTTPPTSIPLFGFVPDSLAFATSISFFPKKQPTALIATIGGNPLTGIRGLIAVYPIIDGKVSGNPTLNTPEDIMIPFAAQNIPGTQSIFVVEGTIGAAIIDISDSGVATTRASTVIPNRNATCWFDFIPRTNSAILTDAFFHQVSEVDRNTGALLQSLIIDNGNPGNTEVIAVSDRIYTLSPGFAEQATSIVVLDSSRGRGNIVQIQNFPVKGLKPDPSAAGLAMWG